MKSVSFLALIFLAICVSNSSAQAQPPSGSDVESVVVPELRAPSRIGLRGNNAAISDIDETRDVVFMIRTKDFRDLNTLRGDLTNAASRAGARWRKDGLHLEAIDPGAWRKLRLAFGMVDNSREIDSFQLKEGAGIQLLATEKENFFQIRVAPDRKLAEAELSYRVSGDDPRAKPTKVTFTPGKQSDDPADKPLRFDNDGIGGHYTLTLPAEWRPEGITVRSGEGKDDVKYEWPQNSLVLGRMEEFSGSIAKMFETLKDRDIMGVPLKGFEESQNITVVVADFVRDFAEPFVNWVSSSEIRIRVPYNREVPSNRIWFLFPLNAEESQKAKDDFANRLPQGDYDLAKALRGTLNRYPTIEESEEPRLDSSADPQWLQLPLVFDANGTPIYFERSFKIQDRKTMQQRYPIEVKSLYLYEKDMVTPDFPHRIVPVEGENGLQHLMEQTLQGWRNRMQQDDQSEDDPSSSN